MNKYTASLEGLQSALEIKDLTSSATDLSGL